MLTRLLAAFVGLLVLLPSLIWGGETAVEILVPLAILVCLEEYATMAFSNDKPAALGWLVAMSALLYTVLLYIGWTHAPWAFGAVVLCSSVWVVLRPGATLVGAADKVGRYVTGVFWITAFLACLVLIRRLDDGLAWIFLTLVLAWAGDTGGYFAGRAFGRHQLYALISPKKTWEGYVGGVVFAVGSCFIVRAAGLPSLTVLDCFLVGPVVGSAGVIGDLAESLLKRSHDVKDSGWIMPGHGGLLDRIDSVLFVAPLLYAYAVIIKGY